MESSWGNKNPDVSGACRLATLSDGPVVTLQSELLNTHIFTHLHNTLIPCLIANGVVKELLGLDFFRMNFKPVLFPRVDTEAVIL